jgi:hypothetical protein
VFGFALVGVWLGHALAYLLALPDPRHRTVLLRVTGHGYLPGLGDVALMLLAASVATVVARAWSGRGMGRPERFLPLAAFLAVMQAAAFVGQEVAERLLAGSTLDALFDHHLLLTGVLVQCGLALAGAASLRWLGRASVRIAEVASALGWAAAPAGAVLAAPIPASCDEPHGRVLATDREARAPPPR